MTRYLLDTNVVSELRKRKPHGGVVAWLASLHAQQVFVSAVTIGELQTGVEMTLRQDAVKAQEIESWLASVETSFSLIAMDSACFREWSRLIIGRPDTLRQDAMIAATARVHGFEIATRDEHDFKLLGARIVNPFKTQPR
jgi:predicted nucleic acid-binding protein